MGRVAPCAGLSIRCQMTMNMLAQAQGVCGTTAGQDEDMVDYINGLRESVLEAYSGIVQVHDPLSQNLMHLSLHEGMRMRGA